jgi:hypothetical protein
VIEAELEAILNTLTELNLKDAFKILQKSWEWRIRGEYFKGDGQ